MKGTVPSQARPVSRQALFGAGAVWGGEERRFGVGARKRAS